MACDRIANGAVALDHIRATRPDLVLLDIMLPEVSGYEICEGIRNDPALAEKYVRETVFKGQLTSALSAWVCADCGYVELYATAPEDIKDGKGS